MVQITDCSQMNSNGNIIILAPEDPNKETQIKANGTIYIAPDRPYRYEDLRGFTYPNAYYHINGSDNHAYAAGIQHESFVLLYKNVYGNIRSTTNNLRANLLEQNTGFVGGCFVHIYSPKPSISGLPDSEDNNGYKIYVMASNRMYIQYWQGNVWNTITLNTQERNYIFVPEEVVLFTQQLAQINTGDDLNDPIIIEDDNNDDDSIIIVDDNNDEDGDPIINNGNGDEDPIIINNNGEDPITNNNDNDLNPPIEEPVTSSTTNNIVNNSQGTNEKPNNNIYCVCKEDNNNNNLIGLVLVVMVGFLLSR